MSACSLCAPDLAPILDEGVYWRLVLNHNQNLLGKCFLVLRRHEEAVVALTTDEWMELQQHSTRATHALVLAFAPDHFNYAFVQNEDPHVHLHIIPRYAGTRTFAGRLFIDPDYPDHYAVPSPTNRLSADEALALAEHLRSQLSQI